MAKKKPKSLPPATSGHLRDFVRLPDGRIGLIVANDHCGGVFRGHVDIWFGELDEDRLDRPPLVWQLPITNEWEVIERPIGIGAGEDP